MDNAVVSVKREDWIDIGKLVAICAVMLDHTKGVLYTSRLVQHFSGYSVSLFIILVGMTAFSSMQRHSESAKATILRRFKAILFPYMIATAVYQIAGTHRFDLYTYFNQLIRFNASGPLYFVGLYIQLVVVSPLLFGVILRIRRSKYNSFLYVISLIILGFFSSVCGARTSMFHTYGGGSVLFGGSYLFLYFLGMCTASLKTDILSILNNWRGIIAGCLFFASALYVFYYCESVGKHFWSNPPTIWLSVFAILVFFALFSFSELVNKVCNTWLLKTLKITGGGRRAFISFYIIRCFYLLLRDLIFLHSQSGRAVQLFS